MYSFFWFWMNATFYIPFFFGALLVLRNTEKKNMWILKTCVAFLLFFGWSFAWQAIIYNLPSEFSESIPFSHITFFVQIAMMIGYIRLAYKVDIWTDFFATTVTYSLQHFSNRLYLVICSTLSMVIQDESLKSGLWSSWLGVIICFVVMGLSYFLWWFLLLRKFDQESFDNLVNKKVQVLTSAIVIVFSIFINSYIANDSHTTAFIMNMGFLLSLAISFLVVLLDYASVYERKTMKENEKLVELLRSEKADYESSKENYDLINIKLHDIKHLLNTLNSSTDETTIHNIKESLTSFEHNIKTGNEAVDVIISKKKRECKEKKIKFTCFLDARGLEYISPYELYTLFDNAINNAIDASLKCSLENRIISVHGNKKDDFLQIIFTNYFCDDVRLENNLPLTMKDKRFHGFGMKSMKMLAEKHNGNIYCSINENLFSLYINLPLNPVK